MLLFMVDKINFPFDISRLFFRIEFWFGWTNEERKLLFCIFHLLLFQVVEQSEPIKLVISHNASLLFSIKFLHFWVKLFTFSIGRVRVMLTESICRPKNSSFWVADSTDFFRFILKPSSFKRKINFVPCLV